MKKWLILFLLLTPSVARANTVTPQFTQGSMNATTTTTQTVTETIQTQVFGGDYSSWNGNNVTATSATSSGISGTDTVFTITDSTLPFTLETVTRSAGVVEQIDITRNITTNATTTSLSVFSQ
tara:strand:- start:74 stop:442 length:369 start_codon:yes stop_codon:yes gene_type:complete